MTTGGTPHQRRRRHGTPDTAHRVVTGQLEMAVRRLERRVGRRSGTVPDWFLYQVELQALHEVAARTADCRIRSFGAAAFVRRATHRPERTVEMLVFARVGATLPRPLLNETAAPGSDLEQLVWTPFLICSEAFGNLTRLPWLDLRTVKVRGSRQGYLGDLGAGPQALGGVVVNSLPGSASTLDPPASGPVATISSAAARVWDWQPGRLVPVEYVPVRRETDGASTVEILWKRGPS